MEYMFGLVSQYVKSTLTIKLTL